MLFGLSFVEQPFSFHLCRDLIASVFFHSSVFTLIMIPEQGRPNKKDFLVTFSLQGLCGLLKETLMSYSSVFATCRDDCLEDAILGHF